MIISAGFDDCERVEVAEMYWSAFGEKLGPVLGPTPRAVAFIGNILDPAHALCARDARGVLLGVVGFKTVRGALIDGTLRDLAQGYGWFGALWRGGLLALLQRDTDNDRFLIDGIFVNETVRGQGIGTALLEEICVLARRRGYGAIRLDVSDTNPRARALYEGCGFECRSVHRLGILRYVFGFASSTAMVRQL